MCGIAGFLNRRGLPPGDAGQALARMTAPLARRGPDARGAWVAADGTAGLGHSRLSVIDPSPAGNQPMISGDGRWIAVFNGEIYNYRELRAELEERGERFRTSTDTEVLMAAYSRFGPECLSRLNGMFAFAIRDVAKRELFLARDRLGVKPLLYYRGDGLFLFGSELKAVRAFDSLDLTLDLSAIRRYFYLSYIPSPDTVYREVKRLEAGHYMVVTDESVRCVRWYDLAPHYNVGKMILQNDGERLLRDLLEDSVRARLVADVPLGAFLSGGVDSSLVVGLMAKHSGRKVRTFTVGYHDDPVYDESRHAREVAAHFGTEHTEIMLSVKDGIDAIPEVLDYFDQPFGDSSSIPTYLVSRETRKSVKVALSGDGGDELFAGYSKYQVEAYAPYFGFVPDVVRSAIRRSMAGLPEGRQTRLHESIRRMKKAARSAEPDQVARHCALMFPLAEEEMESLVPGEAAAEIRRLVAGFMGRIGGDTIDRALFADVNLCLKDDMLVKVDLMGMSNSLEVRNPFLDFRVVELAARMPGTWKLKGRKRKHILLSAFRGFIPPSVLSRKKQGFGVPVGEWLRKELKGIFNDTVSRAAVERAGVLEYDAVERVYRAHLSGKRDATPLLWSILAFQWWANRNL